VKVVLHHPTLLPPRDYGGVERVVLWLAKGLVELGHEVWVGAQPGSRLPEGARLLEIPPERASALDLIPILPQGVDIVHFQAPPEAGTWEALACPGVLTVHGNGKPGEVFPKNTVFLSRDHAQRHGSEQFVYNGIDPEEYRFEPDQKEDWALFLSKTSWRVKNVAGAIDLCTRARMPLKIAGGNRPLTARLRARLNPRMQWVGPVSGAKKAELLAHAKAFIFPVLWSEPFGLVVAEALMSGTPVIAACRGSIPELVPSDVGVTLSNEPGSESVWVEWLSRREFPWSPERCRAWAMEKFHYKRMAQSYEEIYRRLS
jgi:glycosyltransferase involved in cell wall biosynthesis